MRILSRASPPQEDAPPIDSSTPRNPRPYVTQAHYRQNVPHIPNNDAFRIQAPHISSEPLDYADEVETISDIDTLSTFDSRIHSTHSDTYAIQQPIAVPPYTEPASPKKLFLRQTQALFRKNVTMFLRDWAWTLIRSLIIPATIIACIGCTKVLFLPLSTYGIAEPKNKVAPFTEAMGNLKFFYYSNNEDLASSTDIQPIMSTVLQDVPQSQIHFLSSSEEIFNLCPLSLRGVSPCYGGVQWNRIDAEQNIYNYTIRGNPVPVTVDIEDNKSSIDQYILPLQLAIDNAIRNSTVQAYTVPYTSMTDREHAMFRDQAFLLVLRKWASPVLYIGLIGMLYHLAGAVALERELGLSDLLRSMGTTAFATVASFSLSFGIFYTPGWFIIGSLFYRLCFDHTSPAITIFFVVFHGISAVPFSIFIGTFFRKAQFAGIFAAVCSIVLSILATVSASTPGLVYFCSFFFNPMSFIFFIRLLTSAEAEYRDLNLFEKTDNIYPFVVFISPLFQTICYLSMTFLADRLLYNQVSTPPTAPLAGSAIEITSLTKTYKNLFSAKDRSVTAVKDLTLSVAPNQIFSVLGANGSGKTTTMEMVAGIQNPTAGSITFRPGSKIGICPQRNVLWDHLTVIEHVRLWSQLKGVPLKKLDEVSKYFIEKCGLTESEYAYAKTLSGGQKRKLQLAIMFTGGTNVCCIDEVSSGLDPVSRRVIWDILMGFKSTHTILLTTHFLDEADILSDNIAVLSKGVLCAQGTPMALKESLGDGYRVFIDHSGSGYEESYQFPTPQAVLSHITGLEKNGIAYRVAGPELETVFLKLAGKDHEDFSFNQNTGNDTISLAITMSEKCNKDLERGDVQVEEKPMGFISQVLALLVKRVIVFKRSPAQDIAFLIIPIIVAGFSSSFLTRATANIICGTKNLFGSQTYLSPASYGAAFDIPFFAPDFSSVEAGFQSFAGGQSSWESTSEAAASSFELTLRNGLSFVDSFDSWYNQIETNFSRVLPGGLFLGDNYTLAYVADSDMSASSGIFMMNMLSNLVDNSKTIVTNYSPFQTTWVSNFSKNTQFVVLFGYAMSIAPAFAALYPTYERLSNVRAMQYSNGLRVLPLWTAYLLFYVPLILILCDVCLGVMASKLVHIYAAGHMYVTFFMFLIDSILISFIISLFVKSQLAAFAVAAFYQVVGVTVYLMSYFSLQAYSNPLSINYLTRIVYYTSSLISPVQSFMRTLFLALNLFSTFCDENNNTYRSGDIRAQGGPILYLFVQFFVLFGFLIWWENGLYLNKNKRKETVWKSLKKRFAARWLKKDDVELSDITSIPPDVLQERLNIEQNPELFANGLAIHNLTKVYNRKAVVDNISFGVKRGECFALLGPNGAGKTTTFNMARGEIPLSSGDIFVNGISVSHERSLARTKLGVCPQFDAMDKMTVLEVLNFYARLRGVKGNREMIQSHVDNLIKSVSLNRYRDRMAYNLSGGNKRKLSLAVALVGNPEVLLLDEPSSGMDAFAKRIMWKVLSEVASGRSMVLTTHSMEEADALANRAGILASKIITIGGVDRLRAMYGDVIHVHIVCNDAPATSVDDMNLVVDEMKTIFPGATIEDRVYQGQIKMAIPSESPSFGSPSSSSSDAASVEGINLQNPDSSGGIKISHIFRELEKYKEVLNIRSYSVSPTRLEEVFLKVVGDYEAAKLEE